MVISPSEKAVLLERLQKARETKAAKAAEAKKAKAAVEPVVEPPPPPAPAPPTPVIAPAPAPEPVAEAAPVAPEVPDLVAMSKKKPAKKKCIVPSDDDSEEDDDMLPPKKGKKQAYMKIKIYKEPKNAVAFQSLVEAIQDEQPEPETPPPLPPASASVGRSCKFDIKNATPKEGRTLMTQQELMRRAALEFFG